MSIAWLNKKKCNILYCLCFYAFQTFNTYIRGCHGRVVVGFITTYAISAIITKVASSNPAYGQVYLIGHYVINFVSELQLVGGFLQVL